jgi:hypothetical protein
VIDAYVLLVVLLIVSDADAFYTSAVQGECEGWSSPPSMAWLATNRVDTRAVCYSRLALFVITSGATPIRGRGSISFLELTSLRGSTSSVTLAVLIREWREALGTRCETCEHLAVARRNNRGKLRASSDFRNRMEQD